MPRKHDHRKEKNKIRKKISSRRSLLRADLGRGPATALPVGERGLGVWGRKKVWAFVCSVDSGLVNITEPEPIISIPAGCNSGNSTQARVPWAPRAPLRGPRQRPPRRAPPQDPPPLPSRPPPTPRAPASSPAASGPTSRPSI